MLQMGNGVLGPLGEPVVLLVEAEIKLGVDFAITQHLTLVEQLVLGQHQKNKTVPPKTAQLVS